MIRCRPWTVEIPFLPRATKESNAKAFRFPCDRRALHDRQALIPGRPIDGITSGRHTQAQVDADRV